MKFVVNDWPLKKTRLEYDAEINRMVDRLTQLPEVRSVYQIGGLSAPGISDIDMVVVMKDGTSTDFFPLEGANRYLFTHSLFGVTERSFRECQPYNFFHNYTLLDGDEVLTSAPEIDIDVLALKRQIALEYLVRMVINNMVANHQRLLGVRSLLLQAHAVRYDLEFLGRDSGALFDAVAEIGSWRSDWFNGTQPSDQEFETWYLRFDQCLDDLLAEESNRQPIFLPDRPSFRVGKNITVKRSDAVGRHKTGVSLGKSLVGCSKLARRVNNRLARFQLDLPWTSFNVPRCVQAMFDLNARMKKETATMMPRFFPLTSSLHLF